MKIVLYIPEGYEKFIDRDAENDYCRYAGEYTIGCQQCRYFEQEDGEKNEQNYSGLAKTRRFI